MLLTDPKQRASLQEIMNHPWMIKGFGSPPENHLPVREPLQLPLDPAVIQAMTGFDFGPPELIQAQLTKVIESQAYLRAVRLAIHERENQGPRRDPEKKRFGFNFYKRNSMTSQDILIAPSLEDLQLGSDPIKAFYPLISVYYLVREKQDRGRLATNPGATSLYEQAKLHFRCQRSQRTSLPHRSQRLCPSLLMGVSPGLANIEGILSQLKVRMVESQRWIQLPRCKSINEASILN
jgi:hypothetical protein